MNVKRLVVLLLAAGSAGVVALMVRNVLGGGSKPAAPAAAPVEVAEVLVAAQRIDPGRPVTAAQVRWQSWPAKGIDASFIRRTANAGPNAIVDGTVARAPMVEGEPVTFAKIVRSQGAGFMAATITPGMRALSINASMASIVGGFVQPNNRVDLLYTNTSDYRKRGSTILAANVRVLAVDQGSDSAAQKPVTEVKTVTLELTTGQVRAVAMAQSGGMFTLALRSLGDEDNVASNAASNGFHKVGDAKAPSRDQASDSDALDGNVTVLRYGVMRKGTGQ